MGAFPAWFRTAARRQQGGIEKRMWKKRNEVPGRVMQKPVRQASIELLRSIAMLMVITLHYLGKGEILTPLSQTQTMSGYGAWLLESFCIVAVNVYVLISGYYLTESGFKFRRLVTLAAQIVFYSVLVPVVLVLCGVLSVEGMTLYQWLNYLLPVQTKHYWFGTAYLLMYLCVPVLSAGVMQMGKKQLQVTIFLLLLVFSISKSVLPFQLALDTEGYDVTWFLCLFLIAAYVRLYGVQWLNGRLRGWICYVGSCIGIFLLSIAIAFLSNRFGKFDYFINSPYGYNHILCLLGALGIFHAFLHWNMPEGIPARIARKIGPYTFGVYLLHEHAELKFRWPWWFGMEQYGEGSWSPLHWIGIILVIFTVGIIVDYLRSLLFKGVEAVFCKSFSRK